MWGCCEPMAREEEVDSQQVDLLDEFFLNCYSKQHHLPWSVVMESNRIGSLGVQEEEKGEWENLRKV